MVLYQADRTGGELDARCGEKEGSLGCGICEEKICAQVCGPGA